MATRHERICLVGLLCAAFLCMGCSLLSVPVFLLSGMNSKIDPKFPLASKDKDKEVKVLILASGSLETRPEFLRSDREISSFLSTELTKQFKENKEKVTVIPISQVEKYKDEHPNWHALNPIEIGEHFKADYVIDLAIESLSLYEPGSGNQLFRGRTEIAITVVDVKQRGGDPVYREQYICEYPKTRGPIPAADGNPQQFRLRFLQHIAKHLSWIFTAHPTSEMEE